MRGSKFRQILAVKVLNFLQLKCLTFQLSNIVMLKQKPSIYSSEYFQTWTKQALIG